MRADLSGKRVAIVGSRSFKRLDAVDSIVADLPPDASVVSGGAAGVDTRAIQAARARKLGTAEFRADWNTHGKKAGILRNTQIVEFADVVIAFWDGQSRGTADTIRKALKAHKPTALFAPLQGRDVLIWLRSTFNDPV